MTRFLVTGAAGFIGRSISKKLLDEGHFVRGIDNFSTGKRENLVGLDKLEFVDGDITDPAAMAAACDGIEVVYHEAALASVPRSVKDPIASNHANVTGTLQVLYAAKEAKVRRVVYAASSSAYGDTPTLPKREDMIPGPISPYAVTKLTGEYYMQSFYKVYGLETVSLRYFNVFGPYQDPNSMYSGVLAKFIPQMLQGDTPTIYGDGDQSRDFTFIENVVNANLLAASVDAAKVAGKVFNVATGSRVTLNQTVEVLRHITNYMGPVNHTTERTGDVKHSLADIAAAQKALGYKPTVDFQEGLRRTVDWYRMSLDSMAARPASRVRL